MPKIRRKAPTVELNDEPQGERKSVLRREIAAALPDPNDPEVLARLKAARAAMNEEAEEEALRWMETVSMFDNEDRDLE